jgi:hypothetical protein
MQERLLQKRPSPPGLLPWAKLLPNKNFHTTCPPSLSLSRFSAGSPSSSSTPTWRTPRGRPRTPVIARWDSYALLCPTPLRFPPSVSHTVFGSCSANSLLSVRRLRGTDYHLPVLICLDLNWSFNFTATTPKMRPLLVNCGRAGRIFVLLFCASFIFPSPLLFWQTRLGPEDRIFPALLHQEVFTQQWLMALVCLTWLPCTATVSHELNLD